MKLNIVVYTIHVICQDIDGGATEADGGATEADGGASAPVGPSVATPLCLTILKVLQLILLKHATLETLQSFRTDTEWDKHYKYITDAASLSHYCNAPVATMQ